MTGKFLMKQKQNFFYPSIFSILQIQRYFSYSCFLAFIFVSGCSRWAREKYEPPPSTINITADANAKALRRALSLQKLTSSQPGAGSYTIGPNDVVEIKVFEHEGMSLSTRVNGNGVINFPPLGDIQAGGLNERQLETLIQDRLRGAYVPDPHVTVFVREIQARMVGIIGAVNLPGQYSSFGQMRLADIISKAGGLKPEVGEVAYVVRYNTEPVGQMSSLKNDTQGSTDTIKVDLDGLLLRGERDWNIALEAGDLVNVPTAGMVFITGYGIRKPGTYPLTNRMTLQQLVDLAEGLKFEAKHKVLLVRTRENGSKEIYKVDYDELREARTADIQLRSGDKIIVDRTPVKTALATIGRGMAQVFRVMVSANYRISSEENNNSSSD
jgi:polysaccharide biosynthesis/export protein